MELLNVILFGIKPFGDVMRVRVFRRDAWIGGPHKPVPVLRRDGKQVERHRRKRSCENRSRHGSKTATAWEHQGWWVATRSQRGMEWTHLHKVTELQ
jgi:hypothetical protein